MKPLDRIKFIFCALEVRTEFLRAPPARRFVVVLIQTFHYYHPSGAAPLGTPGLATF